MTHLSDELLNEYLDGVLPDRALVESHLAECADCARRLAALRAVFADLESLPEAALSRDLAAPIALVLGGRMPVPRSLRLAVAVQAAVAVVALIFAAPVIQQFAEGILPTLQAPSFTEGLVQVQELWTTWLDMLSQFRMPTIPEISVSDLPSLVTLSALAGISVLWLVGNGWLLRSRTR